MPPLYSPTYRYDDPSLTPPAPGRDLIMTIGLVHSVPGIGPKTGGGYIGIPRAIGSRHTKLWRPYDGIEMTLPNEQLMPWTTPFRSFALRTQGIHPLSAQRGWEWLRWTVADHLAHDAAAQRTSNPLVVIPCGSTKAKTEAPAARLYRGTYFRLGLRAALALTGPDSIRILSARHGLLALHTMVEPYELRLGQPGSITAAELRAQALSLGLIDRPEVVLFGGRDYVELAKQVWPCGLTPLAGTAGIGEQQRRLASIAAAGCLN